MERLDIELKARFLRPLQELAEALRRQVPGRQLRVYEGPVGSATEYQGYDVGIECLLPNVSPDQPDNVALQIGVCHLTSKPRVMADVVWGHPSGHVEAAFREDWSGNHEWPEATPDVLQAIEDDLPRLTAAFVAAVKRGQPTDE
jgi:hypothetical protein